MTSDAFARAVALIREADGLLVTAGAGMGVDSGLPDFRSNNGFWKSYPALAHAGIQFESIANPDAFRRDPDLAWGFYGHRLNLYRKTDPHDGFRMLLEIAGTLKHGCFVFTSNVDGQFQKAGFSPERIYDVHGSIHHLQCMNENCTENVWSADGFLPVVDDESCRLTNALPSCLHCNRLARPNILMFGDWNWRSIRAHYQARHMKDWLDEVRRPVVIEIGAGTDIATVRRASDRFERLIRINPREPEVRGPKAVGIPEGGLAGLTAIYQAYDMPRR